MIEAASLHVPQGRIHYTGIDLFEARSSMDGPGVTLKMAHRLLKATGARTQLLPGDPLTALSREANCLTGTDLVIISARQDRSSLARAWFYVPRMLHPGSQVYVEEVGRGGRPPVLRRLAPDEIARLATPAPRRQAA